VEVCPQVVTLQILIQTDEVRDYDVALIADARLFLALRVAIVDADTDLQSSVLRRNSLSSCSWSRLSAFVGYTIRDRVSGSSRY